MNHLARVVCPVAEMWRFDERKGHRVLRLTDGGWADEAGKVVFELAEAVSIEEDSLWAVAVRRGERFKADEQEPPIEA